MKIKEKGDMSKKEIFRSSSILMAVFIIVIVICISQAMGRQIKGSKKLEIIKEMKLKKSVKNLIIDNKSLNPKVYIKENGIEFLDKTGNIKKKYLFEGKNTKVERSRGDKYKKSEKGKYIGVTTILELGSKYEIKDAKFTMLDIDGNTKWEVKHNFWKLFPSPDGTYAIGMPDPEWGGAPLYLINSKGKEKQISEEGADRSLSPHFSISEDGNIITVTVRKLRENPEKSLFVVLDRNGDELWRKESEDKSISGIPSEKYIAVFTTDKKTKECVLSMCDLQGNILWEYKPFKGAGYVYFSEDLRYLFSPWELYEVEIGKLLWRHEEYIKGGYIFTTPNFEFIILISGRYDEYDKYKLIADTFYLFNRNGEKLLYEEYPPDYIIFRDYRPVVNISPDGRNILMETKEGVKILKNPYAE